jgi:hypothetical protein
MPDDTPRKPRIIDTPDPDRPPPEPEQPRQKLKLGTKKITEVNRIQEATSQPITVHGILAENLRRTVPAEKPMDLRKRTSRRKRDYWLCLVLGNALFASALLFTRQPIVLSGCIAACAIFTTTLTWIMWQVMSDY